MRVRYASDLPEGVCRLCQLKPCCCKRPLWARLVHFLSHTSSAWVETSPRMFQRWCIVCGCWQGTRGTFTVLPMEGES
jgi:hypothetical protein